MATLRSKQRRPIQDGILRCRCFTIDCKNSKVRGVLAAQLSDWPKILYDLRDEIYLHQNLIYMTKNILKKIYSKSELSKSSIRQHVTCQFFECLTRRCGLRDRAGLASSQQLVYSGYINRLAVLKNSANSNFASLHILGNTSRIAVCLDNLGKHSTNAGV